MGWSNCEDLICIAEDGAVYIYDMFGTFQRQFSLGLVCFDIFLITYILAF